MESKPRSPNDFIISLRELWVFSKGAEDISAGPVWCYPRDQSQLLDIGHRRESPSVTTTLFTLYLRILLYNKFDVAKPSDHITTIKLIPPSYSGGPRSGPAKSVSRITNNKLSLNSGRNFVFWGFFSNTVVSANVFVFLWSYCFCPCPDLIKVCSCLQHQGQWHCSILNTTFHLWTLVIRASRTLSDFQQLSSKLY